MTDHDALPVLMASVLGELPAIGKDDKAPSQMGGYAFRGIESITAALKPLLAKHGVFVVPTTTERIESSRQLKSGSYMWVIDVHVLWTFYGPAGDTIECSTWGQGTDMGDKATQKAYTSAFKSMLGQAFCIADSETDAERHQVPESAKTSAGGGGSDHPPAPQAETSARGESPTPAKERNGGEPTRPDPPASPDLVTLTQLVAALKGPKAVRWAQYRRTHKLPEGALIDYTPDQLVTCGAFFAESAEKAVSA